jgi:hypothetical protein
MGLFEPDINDGIKYDIAKHELEKKAAEAAEKARKEEAEARQRHEEDQRQGMI